MWNMSFAMTTQQIRDRTKDEGGEGQ